MATHGDTLSTVLLAVAICSWASAALGALALAVVKSRRWRASRARREVSTHPFRLPVVHEASEVESLDEELADPTERLTNLFEAQAPANDDPFDGDTTPLLDVEEMRPREAVADV